MPQMAKYQSQGRKFEFALAWLQIQISRPDLDIWSFGAFSAERFSAIKKAPLWRPLHSMNLGLNYTPSMFLRVGL